MRAEEDALVDGGLEDVENLSEIEAEMNEGDVLEDGEAPSPIEQNGDSGEVPDVDTGLSFALCDDIAHYSGLASWAFLVLFILGAVIDQPVIQSVGMFGAIATIAVSMLFDELAARKIGESRGTAGIAVLVLVAAAVIASVVGFMVGKPELVAGGVFGLLVLSFVPSVIDHFSASRSDDDYYYHPAHSASGYSEFGEIFGVHTPKPQPPITIEKGEELDEDWQEYLGVEVPDVDSLRNPPADDAAEPIDKLDADDVQEEAGDEPEPAAGAEKGSSEGEE